MTAFLFDIRRPGTMPLCKLGSTMPRTGMSVHAHAADMTARSVGTERDPRVPTLEALGLLGSNPARA